MRRRDLAPRPSPKPQGKVGFSVWTAPVMLPRRKSNGPPPVHGQQHSRNAINEESNQLDRSLLLLRITHFGNRSLHYQPSSFCRPHSSNF
ncbi:hypothetical protein TNCV_1088931 [Trichonephila clavipes]|uniref:Uncharacterized protein n=1 Tax=Trichonephila clavipes TaxID=2585209 RepID=A0A8X6SNN0_TRICX|nr:hypothetical protein TNCV_1088931 [Trichonephila clavipes]